ncbi:MAG: autotransporter domain-containing protein [Pseudomonadota bacterium]
MSVRRSKAPASHSVGARPSSHRAIARIVPAVSIGLTLAFAFPTPSLAQFVGTDGTAGGDASGTTGGTAGSGGTNGNGGTVGSGGAGGNGTFSIDTSNNGGDGSGMFAGSGATYGSLNGGGAGPASGGGGGLGTSQGGAGAAGGGGGGGGNGYVQSGGTFTDTVSITGGKGGNGGGGSPYSAGGGGGGGGNGVLLNNGGTFINNGAAVAGGNGGVGGAGRLAPGGGGGFGVYATSGGTIQNSGSITGGARGSGAGGAAAQSGTYAYTDGAGIGGAGLIIINSGSIAGGGSGNAITFTGGANTLTLQGSSWALTGNIEIDGSGSVSFNQAAAQTIGNVIAGNGSVVQDGAGALTLSIANTYSGGTAIDAGSTLIISNSNALGTGTVALNGGTTGATLNFNGNLTVANKFTVSGDPTFNVLTGNTTALPGQISGTGDVVVNDATGYAGTLVLSNATNNYTGATSVDAGTLQAGAANVFGTNSAMTVASGATLDLGGYSQSIGSLSGAGTVTSSAAGAITLTTGSDNSSTIFSGIVQDGSGTLALTKTGTGTLVLSNPANNYSGATSVEAGTLQAGAANVFGTNSAVTVASGATLDLDGYRQSLGSLSGAGTVTSSAAGAITLTTGSDNSSTIFSGIVQDGSGTLALTKTGTGTLVLSNPANNYSGATNIDAGTLQAGAANVFGANPAMIVASSATLDLGGYSQSLGSLSGAGTVTSSAAGAITLTTGSDNSSTTFSGIIQDGSGTLALTKSGTGTLVLSGISSYTGPTSINAGSLEIDGSIAGSSLITVNNGGTLTGTGTLGTTQVNSGGIFAPGTSGVAATSMTINGNLTLSGGSTYVVTISPTQSSKTQVNGTAVLGGASIVANITTPQFGLYVDHTYTILAATKVQGTFNPTVSFVASGLTSAEAITFQDKTSLSYDPNDVDLSIAVPAHAVTLALPSNAPYNAQNAAGAINTSILAGRTLPSGFQNLVHLSGNALNNAVNQLAGQPGGASVATGFTAGDMFLGAVLDPFVAGRDQGFGPGAGTPIAASESGMPIAAAPALAYADDQATARADKLFSAVMPPSLASYGAPQPHLTFWASAYGGTGSITGSAVTGAGETQNQIYGLVAGLDDHISPDTMIGFALGGGGTGWQLDQGLGSGHSGMAQASVYGSKYYGPAYVSGALAYSWQGVSTSRVVTLAGSDTLDANFGANVISSRLETGYRLPANVLPASILPATFALTPYAAAQAQAMFLPAYGEYAASGSSEFALTSAARDYSTIRTELGSWFDTDLIIAALPFTQSGALKVYGRAAWAHDFNNENTAISFFQQLPGASFLINTAKPAANSALVTAGLEYKLADGWSILAKFDGEYSSTTAIYAGTGVLKKVW